MATEQAIAYNRVDVGAITRTFRWPSGAPAGGSVGGRVLVLLSDNYQCFARPFAWINDFPGEAYDVIRPIPVQMQPTGNDFVAGFAEGGVYASGDTTEEAEENLRASILDTFETLSANQHRLAVVAQRQFQVLSRIITSHVSTD